MNTRSLRFQLLTWYVALMVVAVTAFGIFMHLAVTTFLKQTLEDTLTRRAHSVERLMQGADEVSPKSLKDQIERLFAPELSSRFIRISKGPQILYKSGTPQDASFDADVPVPSARDKETFRVEDEGTRGEILIKILPVESNGGPMLIEFGAPMAPIMTAVNRVMLALVLGAPVLIAVAAFGANILIGRALSPVVRMARSAEDISLHNLNERLPQISSGDELETLALALNNMISRLDEAVEQTRRFVADASHELRTPLAILRGELENVVNRNSLSKETKDTLGSNLEEVERLGKIVEGLFALSRLDSGEAHHESLVFDLGKLAATTTDQMCLLAEDKGISLVATSPEPIFVCGDSARLKQVIVNLVDNAIKYTQPGGRVQVTARAEEGKAVLEVADNGIGIPKRDLSHIFERFYRVDKARSREAGGAGLGLSIVKSIVAAHRGEIHVQSQEQEGTRFLVHLPLVSEENKKHEHSIRLRTS